MRHFLRTNDVPIYFVGATPFNLLGLDRWIRNFSYICYYDAWDGAHPRVFTPRRKPYTEFGSGEEINNWLLENAEVRAFIDRRRMGAVRPKIAMVFFDEETERICEELGYDLILPSAQLRHHLDSKLVTTRLGNEVGVASVPNVLTTVSDFAALTEAAAGAGLGSDLVIQTPYGDSGKTTFFISAEADWQRHREDIEGAEIKVMKRINHRPVAVEAVLTRRGTIVGPFMSELTGHPQLTPYRGGWCGNEMFPEVITGALRAKAAGLVRRLGDRLGAAGYRGFFEVDVLVDTDADEVYLGELNPRISGASAITNVTAGAYADVPLFAFHLLEFMDIDVRLRRGRDQRALGGAGRRRRVEPDDHQGDQPGGRADRRRRPDGPVLPGRRRHAGLPAGGAGLASAPERVRGVLPAHLRPRRLPLEGRRPGRPGDQGAAADRLVAAGPGADHPGPAPHRRHPGPVRRDAAGPARGPGPAAAGQQVPVTGAAG